MSPGYLPGNFLIGAIAAILVVALVWARGRQSGKKGPLPPGPPKDLLMGHMPTSNHWIVFSKWAQQYGEIVHLNELGQHFIVLNSPKAITEILVKRSHIYAGRPHFTMAGDLVGLTQFTPLLQPGEQHKRTRKLQTQVLGPKGLKTYLRPVADEKTLTFARKLVRSPEEFAQHVRWLSGAVILAISYGYDAEDSDDKFIKYAEKALAIISDSLSPGWLVDIVRPLRFIPSWFPGAGFKRQAEEWKADIRKFGEEPTAFVKRAMREGTAKPSFASALLTGLDESESRARSEDDETITWAVTSLYGGGADTTVSSGVSFFLAMTLYQDAQKRAQAEIDGLLKGTRLPTLDDRERLPYIAALLSEIHRWNPVFPLAFFHVAAEDDVYEGYHIPKGTVMLPNNWRVLHDPSKYKDPTEFIPERFLGSTPEEDPKHFAFGYGRRECPGMQFAEVSLWLMMATTLAVFDISPYINEQGNPVVPKAEYFGTIVRHVAPFKCNIQPRSEAALALLAGN